MAKWRLKRLTPTDGVVIWRRRMRQPARRLIGVSVLLQLAWSLVAAACRFLASCFIRLRLYVFGGVSVFWSVSRDSIFLSSLSRMWLAGGGIASRLASSGSSGETGSAGSSPFASVDVCQWRAAVTTVRYQRNGQCPSATWPAPATNIVG